MVPVSVRYQSSDSSGRSSYCSADPGETGELHRTVGSVPLLSPAGIGSGLHLRNIPHNPQDIVIGAPCFLFRSHALKHIRDRIALRLELTGVKRNPSADCGQIPTA